MEVVPYGFHGKGKSYAKARGTIEMIYWKINAIKHQYGW